MVTKKRAALPRVTRGTRWTLTGPNGKSHRGTLVAHYSANKVKLFVFRVWRPRRG
jgi:hypothetical protein